MALITVDRFLITHLMSIDSSIKIARSYQINECNNDEINDNIYIMKK